MNLSELMMFILYLAFMLGIGIWFFVRSKEAGEKDYFLGGREMGAWVSGLSAGASDMSAWVLMGMPASIYAYGMGKAWIPVGLFIGYSLSWIFIAPRLRSFSTPCIPRAASRPAARFLKRCSVSPRRSQCMPRRSSS